MADSTKTLATLLLDRSGSMQSVRDDTVGAINAWLSELRKAKGEIRFSLVMFDEYDGMDLQKIHVAVPVGEVADLVENQFRPRGQTPLIDAACTTIRAVRESLAGRSDDVKVVFAIQTDGFENASRENRWEDLRALVEECETEGWQFNFMGCGIDAYGQAARMGIVADRTVSYMKAPVETRQAFRAMAVNTRRYADGEADCLFFSKEQKMRSGDRFDPREKREGNAAREKPSAALEGLGWDSG